MELNKKQEESQELMNVIITKCWEDASFKQQLIANPEETIKNLTGKDVNIPEGRKLVVNDQTNDGFIHLNIPAQPNLADLELSDEQLESVAGGIIPVLIIAGGFLIGKYVL